MVFFDDELIHFIYGYMASDIIMVKDHSERKRAKTCYRHYMGYSLRLAVKSILYAPSHRQYSTYHRLCYSSRGALAGTKHVI